MDGPDMTQTVQEDDGKKPDEYRKESPLGSMPWMCLMSLSTCLPQASPRDIDFASSDRFLKKAFDDPLICNERFKNRWFTIKADGQSVLCFGKYVAHQCLRAVKRTADVNFDRLEDNKIAKLKSNNAQR
jgi:hypothetical protein